ncbi:MAG: sigma-70 family RNA polymerase sigma factor [Gammaproteobacteria bacterium]|nr:sigma-70 family RNA polymerase sigma factor [Gammaproteobacteria bacterium]
MMHSPAGEAAAPTAAMARAMAAAFTLPVTAPGQRATLRCMDTGIDDSDETLMARYCDGDAAAFDALYERYRRPLFGFLVNQSRRPATEVEDVFQESWIKLVRYRSQFRAGQKFAPWLYTIARNTLVDRWRHLGTVASVHVSDDIAMQGASSDGLARPERLAASRDIEAAWQAALTALPAEQREVLLLKMESDMSLEEIATVLDTGRETIKSRLRYAMARMRSALEEFDHE